MATTKNKQTPEQAADEKAAVAQAEKERKAAEKRDAREKAEAERKARKAEADKAKAEAAAKRKAEAEAKKNAPKPLCGCGCGQHTKGGRFLPGHDARLHGRAKLLREGGTLPAGLSPEEVAAATAAAAEGHLPSKGSFAPRWDASKGEQPPVKPRADKATLAKRVEATRRLLAQLEAELAAAS